MFQHGADFGINQFEIHRQHDFGTAVVNLKGKFPLYIKWIEIHHRTASSQNGEIADHGIGRVGQAQPDACSFLDTQVLESLRCTCDQCVQFLVGCFTAQEIDSQSGAVQLGRVFKVSNERALIDSA